MKILIIKIAAIGDLLLITPAIRAIKKNFPDSKISLLVGKWSAGIVKDNPNLDQIIEVPDEIFFKFRPFSLFRLIYDLRKQKYDLVFIWHRSTAFKIFGWILGIKKRFGFSRGKNSLFLTHPTAENPAIHEIWEYQSTLSPLGIISAEIDMDLTLSREDLRFADDVWEKYNIGKEDLVAGIAPGGAKNPKETMPLRHWPEGHYAEVIKKLSANNIKIILLGGKSDQAICSLMPDGAIDLCGKTSLKQLAAVIKKCRVLIGNDSAPIHIAAAVKTPAISLFGPTDPMEKAPLNYRHIYFYHPEKCSPCYVNGKFPGCKNKKCLKNIVPEEVLGAALSILKNQDSAKK